MVRNVLVTTPTILAIDLGKFDCFFCWFDVATKSATFRTVPTNEDHFRQALLRQPGVTPVRTKAARGFACDPGGRGQDPVTAKSRGKPEWLIQHQAPRLRQEDATM